MVELRKRKSPVNPPPPPAKKRTTKPSSKPATSNTKATDKKSQSKPMNEAKTEEKPVPDDSEPKEGNKLNLDALSSIEVHTQDETATTLSQVLKDAETSGKNGIAIFTYPKASTPGCTTQACLFRDSFDELGAKLDIYGLSSDSPKANTNFKEKQNLGYTLLCDPKRSLINKLGLAKNGGGGTARGVVVIDGDGKILRFLQGGPAATVDAVREVIEGMK